MLLTTSNNFENYTIERYCGIVSGECVLGTGFLSSLDATIADFLGISSTSYNEKLDSAKQAALSIIEKKALTLGANAIVSVDIDYTTFTSDLIGVVVNGTAVKVTPTGFCKTFTLPSQNNCILKPRRLTVKSSGKTVLAKAELATPISTPLPSCILSDVQFTTFFDSPISLHDIVFSNFSKSDSILESSYSPLPISISQLGQIESAAMSIIKYSLNNAPAVSVFNSHSEVPVSSSRPIEPQSLLSSAELLHSAREILSLLQEWKKSALADIPPELEAQIENLAKAERLYGNMKDSCLQKLKEYSF